VCSSQSRKIEWGFVAWVAGCVVSSLFWDTTIWVGPLAEPTAAWGDIAYLAGVMGSAVVYLIFRFLPPMAKTSLTAERSAVAESPANAGDVRPEMNATATGNGEVEDMDSERPGVEAKTNAGSALREIISTVTSNIGPPQSSEEVNG
jgi:hypothetical protein